ncbi:cysteine desulfurase family protein [Ligilactobacillus ceti]|uniref:Cysteine desulfurase selenocysteine lyase n=1 Tax=Ligilactobacillus ceti DSM 22408 TaxID=1122146 RepID=A0A0R2KNC4_9LACO|nr:cysteine desulfurase family protein [Ligilactobacillus ceti]KRN88949.1 cysteine desulfurase selenocysteine lyase [Ligilactobacillus ceti DSM 22408]
MRRIYLDNAATTPMAPEVIAVMTETMHNIYGNPSSVNQFGREAKANLDASRKLIANSINAKRSDEIVFTSGGSESDNTALIQTAFLRQNEGRHIITTAIEHEAILKPLAYLEEQGFTVTYLPVNEQGVISLSDLKDAITPETILVSIMTGNNEVGSIMPIHEIGEIVAPTNAWFHTDAVQAYGTLDLDVQRDKIDLLSTSAHKLNGPKFLGFLYQRQGLNLPAFIKGGDQELKRRAGTENVPAIAGFAKAVQLISDDYKQTQTAKYLAFKQQLIAGLKANDIEFMINGDQIEKSLPHVINIWFKDQLSDRLLVNLDLQGLSVSAGSACTAGNMQDSHVLVAMYPKQQKRIRESLRFSFGRYNTSEDIDDLIKALVKTIKK